MAESGDLDFGALRERLVASRRRGQPFEQAWAAAIAQILVEPGQPDGRVLSATRSAWAAAYERRPAQRDHRALDTLAETLDDSAHASFGRSALLG